MHGLTIDCSTENRNSPVRYRTSAENPDQQVCYFNKPQDDIFYNVFIRKQIKAENFDRVIYFKILKKLEERQKKKALTRRKH